MQLKIPHRLGIDVGRLEEDSLLSRLQPKSSERLGRFLRRLSLVLGPVSPEELRRLDHAVPVSETVELWKYWSTCGTAHVLLQCEQRFAQRESWPNDVDGWSSRRRTHRF